MEDRTAQVRVGQCVCAIQELFGDEKKKKLKENWFLPSRDMYLQK